MIWSLRPAGMPPASRALSAELEQARIIAALVGFGEFLRRFGAGSGAIGIETAARALAVVDPSDREDVYWALRCALLSDHHHLDVFDRAFSAFWDGAPLATEPMPAPARPAESEPRRGSSDQDASASPVGEHGGRRDDPGEADDDELSAGARFSRDEQLRELDFRSLGPAEQARTDVLIRQLARALPLRVSRRLRRGRSGPAIDRRATLRRAMRTEGHPIEVAYRRRRLVARRLVFLIDVSGSMETYARPLLVFAQAACRASRGVEAFTFGTRLTRVTHQLAGVDATAALARAGEAIPDWAGGTRIGDNLRRLNHEWGRRGITRGAAVVVFSDGWERGGVEELAEEMERLRRASHRLVWVNPLAGDPGYEPLAAGMAAALEHVDVFLPGHNLRNFEGLAAVLSQMPSAGGRRGRARPSLLGSGKTRHGLAPNPRSSGAGTGAAGLV